MYGAMRIRASAYAGALSAIRLCALFYECNNHNHNHAWNSRLWKFENVFFQAHFSVGSRRSGRQRQRVREIGREQVLLGKLNYYYVCIHLDARRVHPLERAAGTHVFIAAGGWGRGPAMVNDLRYIFDEVLSLIWMRAGCRGQEAKQRKRTRTERA